MSKKLTPKQKEGSYRYVYIMSCQQYYKIGITNNPRQRQIQIQTSNPTEVTLEYSSKVLDAEMVERKAHYVLRKYRMRGEWFSITREVVEALIDDIETYRERLYGYLTSN